MIERSEIFYDNQIKVGLLSLPDRKDFPKCDKIRAQLIIGNEVQPRIKIIHVRLEGVDLLKDQGKGYQIVLNPGQTHKITFESECRALHLKVHKIYIEYSRDEDFVQNYDKCKIFLPLLPFLKYSSTNLVPERLVSLWTKLTEDWIQMISPQLNIDRFLYNNSHELETTFPTFRVCNMKREDLQPADPVVRVNEGRRRVLRLAWAVPSLPRVHLDCPILLDEHQPLLPPLQVYKHPR